MNSSPWQILLRERALTEWGNLSSADYEQVRNAILSLARDPRPAGSLKLVDVESWHWRIGRYRLIYQIDDEQQMVIVLGIRARLFAR